MDLFSTSPFLKKERIDKDVYKYTVLTDKIPIDKISSKLSEETFLIKHRNDFGCVFYSREDLKKIGEQNFLNHCYLPFLIKRKTSNSINILENFQGFVFYNYISNHEDFDRVYFEKEEDLHKFYSNTININWRISDYKIVLNNKEKPLTLNKFLKIRNDPNFTTILTYEENAEMFQESDFPLWCYCNDEYLFEKIKSYVCNGSTPRLINTIPFYEYPVEYVTCEEYTDLRKEIKFGIEQLNILTRKIVIGKEPLLMYLYLHNFCNKTSEVVDFDELKSDIRIDLEKRYKNFDLNVIKICDLLYSTYVEISSCYDIKKVNQIIEKTKEMLKKFEEYKDE